MATNNPTRSDDNDEVTELPAEWQNQPTNPTREDLGLPHKTQDGQLITPIRFEPINDDTDSGVFLPDDVDTETFLHPGSDITRFIVTYKTVEPQQ